jgi:cytoskeletal protein CcmA (bactofilin family)
MSFVAHLFGRSERGRSTIAAGTTLNGTIEGAAELVVAGTIKGNVRATAITVAETGRIDGDVTADVLLVAGSVNGTIDATALAVAASGSLSGEAFYEKLEVAPGAALEARCHTRAQGAKTRTANDTSSVTTLPGRTALGAA